MKDQIIVANDNLTEYAQTPRKEYHAMPSLHFWENWEQTPLIHRS